MYVCVCSIARVNKWVAPPQPKVMSACREPCKATTLLIQDAHDEEEDCDDPVLKINNHATGGWRTKDILRGPKSLETKKHGSSKG